MMSHTTSKRLNPESGYLTPTRRRRSEVQRWAFISRRIVTSRAKGT